LKDWKMFVNNKWSKVAVGARMSDWPEIGILDPGPISNNLLLKIDGTPKEGLERGVDYWAVN